MTIENEDMSATALMRTLEAARSEALWIYYEASREFPRKKKKALRRKASELWKRCHKIYWEILPEYEEEQQKILDEIWNKIQVSLSEEEQVDVDTLKERRDA